MAEQQEKLVEVENLVKQGWKVKGKTMPQPKPETKPKPNSN